MRFLVPGAVALSFLSAAFADESTLIFDARLNLWPAQQIAQAELAFLQREVRPAARRAWGSWDACSDEFEVLDVASGAFTEPGATEKAYLYRYCLPGRQIGAQGITVVRNDRVVWHVAYQGGSDTAIGALSDINRDGLSEIVVAGGGTGQGYVIGGITLLELTPNGVMAFGRATTYEDDCGPVRSLVASRRSDCSCAPASTPFSCRRPSPKPVATKRHAGCGKERLSNSLSMPTTRSTDAFSKALA